MTEPTVSVVMITFGHENYIIKSIEGVLMQKCDFQVELIIANDNSPDASDDVVKSFLANKAIPENILIKYIKHKVNKGMMPNFIWALEQAIGKYIAVCEGDDYWTDPVKLQKQINFLEDNPTYSMSCHNAINLYEGSGNTSEIFYKDNTSQDLSMETIVNKWVIPTASMVFKREYIVPLPEWIGKIYSGDFTLALLLRHAGKIYFLKDIMSVYRISFSGSSATATIGANTEFVFNQHIKLLEFFNAETNNLYDDLIISRISNLNKEIRFNELKSENMIKALINMPFMFAIKAVDKARRKLNFN
ncbi:glycosyltransferase [Flavobacterium sp. GP15]|uniref:glycosyltransferase family 2 protein n=1 Tax=Flavobacterium sp. GP15 TaxID=2758567 RepID=UPI00165D4132|nr:glycosyltransferase [Flavobacterium sp. GP15]